MEFKLFSILLVMCIYGNHEVKGQPFSPPVYSPDLESQLRAELFSSYEVMQRPQQLVPVRSALNLLSLNSLDIKNQRMSITGYFYFEWMDSRLSWRTNSNYTNIRFMFTDENHVWSPAIIIENSVEDIDVISKIKVPMRIVNTGLIAWMPTGIYTTSCESDVTFWPLDTQECDVIISSWGYTAYEVSLAFTDDVLVTTFYNENGEWELIGTRYTEVKAEREREKFSRLIFTVTYRRRPLFHILNTLFPVILMGFLTVIIFKLNPESGERVGLALTILLAYAVYLGLISESIPQTSMSASLLSAYLASILLLQTLAVFLTVFYLDMFFRSEEQPVPRWMQSMTRGCLARIACVEGQCASPYSRKTRATTPSAKSEASSTNALVANGDKKPSVKGANGANVVSPKSAWNNNTAESSNSNSCDVTGLDDENDDVTYSWKEIAIMCDTITMYLYLGIISFLTVAIFAVMVNKYFSAYTV